MTTKKDRAEKYSAKWAEEKRLTCKLCTKSQYRFCKRHSPKTMIVKTCTCGHEVTPEKEKEMEDALQEFLKNNTSPPQQ